MVDVSKYPYGVERHPNVTMDLTDSFLNWTGIIAEASIITSGLAKLT